MLLTGFWDSGMAACNSVKRIPRQCSFATERLRVIVAGSQEKDRRDERWVPESFPSVNSRR